MKKNQKTTTVKNILTDVTSTYVNSFSIDYNLATEILLLSKKNIHNKKEREKASKLIEKITSKNSEIYYFCQEFDLIAKYK